MPIPISVNEAILSQGPQQSFDHGGNNAVGTTAEALTATSFECKRGVIVKAAAANTGIIFVGNSDVTNGATDATAGFPIFAGDAVFFEIDNPNKLYVLASVDGEDAFWLAI